MSEQPSHAVQHHPADAEQKAGPISVPTLLIAQAVTHGLGLAFLVIPGSAVFLGAYGSARLPYVYLAVGVSGAAISWTLAAAEARLGLRRLATTTMYAIAAAVGLCWLLLVGAELTLAGAGVLVLFALHLQLGFVFVGAQAGRAFDVQQIKRVFPRIVAGFVFGFMVGGIVAGPLISLLGRAEHLLALSALAVGALAVLIGLTMGRIPRPTEDAPEPGVVEEADSRSPGTVRRVLAIPLVGSVFAYQVLSAMGTQLIEYLVYDQAVVRYPGTDELATFMGRFTAVLNLTDLVALLVIGGFLMTRFGIRFGLAANPVVVTGLVIAALAVTVVSGPGGTGLFVIAGLARIADLTMADLATRTSVNATFQAVPQHLRVGAQVTVEGAGVPLALGLTAGLILALNALSDGSITWVLWATGLVCGAWCLLALVVYRRYQVAVLSAVRGRTLDDESFDFSEPQARRTLVKMTESGSAADIALATGILVRTGAPEAAGALDNVAKHNDPEVQQAALQHFVAAGHPAAGPIAVASTEAEDRRRRLDGLRALGRLHDVDGAHHLSAALTDADTAIRAAAMGSLLIRGAESENSAHQNLTAWCRSSETDDRVAAGLAITEAGRCDDLAQLAQLLQDREPEVRVTAAEAVTALDDEGRGALVDLLVEVDTDVITMDRVMRACGGRPGPASTEAVGRWFSSAPAVGQDSIMEFLTRTGSADPPPAAPDTIEVVIDTELARIQRCESHLAQLPLDGTSGGYRPRLRRAIEQERQDGRRRLILALGLAHGPQLTAGLLNSLDGDGTAAMALEALEVTLTGTRRSEVLRAFRNPDEMPGPGTEVPDTEGSASTADRVVAELATSADWALGADWIQACAVATMLSEGRSEDLGYPSPAGPVTAELLSHRSELGRKDHGPTDLD